jgi:hypothetical protein
VHSLSRRGEIGDQPARLLTTPGKNVDNNDRRGGWMRISALIATLLLAVAAALPQSRSFTGEIMDSQCAGMHSHSRMMAGMDAKSAKECTQKCVQTMGGKYALFDSSSSTAYQLDNQDKASAFAGQKVTVKGTLDSASKTIHVESIEAH